MDSRGLREKGVSMNNMEENDTGRDDGICWESATGFARDKAI